MRAYWWFRPSRLALLVAVPLITYAYLASDSYYRQFGARNVITSDDFFLAWLSMLCFASASWIGEITITPYQQKPAAMMQEGVFRSLFFGLALAATLATLMYLSLFLRRMDLVYATLEGVPGAAELMRYYVSGIPGITSEENLFNVVVVLLMIKPVLTGMSRRPDEKLTLVVILILTSIKVFINSERLALIELLVPLGVLACAQRRRSFAISLAPFGGLVAMFGFFTITEYIRSWLTYYSDKSGSLLDFALTRMFGYYITAINNGAYIYGLRHSYMFPVMTGGWLWRLPISGLPDVLDQIIGQRLLYPDSIKNLLYGLNVEFNNTSAVFAPLTDFGPVLGVVIWTMLGFCSGRLYRKFLDKHPLGLIVYPTWYVGILELTREFYWGDSRYFPSLVVSFALVGFCLVSRPGRAYGHVSGSRIAGRDAMVGVTGVPPKGAA